MNIFIVEHNLTWSGRTVAATTNPSSILTLLVAATGEKTSFLTMAITKLTKSLKHKFRKGHPNPNEVDEQTMDDAKLDRPGSVFNILSCYIVKLDIDKG